MNRRALWFQHAWAMVVCCCLPSCITKNPTLPRAMIEWRMAHEEEGQQLELWRDGRVLLRRIDRSGDPQRSTLIRSLPSSEARAEVIAALDILVLRLPRWVYLPASASSLRVVLYIDGAVCQESFVAVQKDLREWLRAIANTDAAVLSFVDLLLTSSVSQAAFTFMPGDDPNKLLPLLSTACPDRSLRELACQIVQEEYALQILPALRTSFAETLRNDAVGDYLLAVTLLALGCVDGVACVLNAALAKDNVTILIAQKLNAEEINAQKASACALLANYFRTRFLNHPDPLLAPNLFLAFIAEHRATLVMDTRRHCFVFSEP
ncbi:MAG: hypothetical protein NT107_15155 [Planctomycetota bacterium]|nr:hypothetical protein [Planctomycetota bacterium]